MAISRWKPFGDLVSLHDRINRLFEDEFSRDFPTSTGLTSAESWYPAADIYETKDDYVFKLEVPGLSKDEVNVEVHNNVLTIKGEKKEEKEVKKENYHRIESFTGSFARSFSLPRNADANKIQAGMKDGILELRVAKSEATKPKAIRIGE
ncbi:MAG: Hsp20/alpha crystallin family protein [Candidatus Omnitrophota bacterium]